MDTNKEKFYSLGDIFNAVKSFSNYLFRKWWAIVIASALGALAGYVFSDMQKPRYEAVSTFILEEKQPGMSGLGSIASQFGLDMGSMGGGGSLFAGDNILDILRSKKVIKQVLLSPVNNPTIAGATLADLYINFSGQKEADKKNILSQLSFSKAQSSLSPKEDSVLNSIYYNILKRNLVIDRVSKKGTIISVQINAENSIFARLMSERLVDEAAKLYFTIKTGTAQSNIERLQRRSDSLLFLLNRRSYTAAASQPLDINPGFQTAIVPVEIANRDKAVISTLYTEVTKNLEASKLLLSQQTPIIQLLDRPSLLLDDKQKGQFFWITLFAFVSSIFCTVLIGFFYMGKKLRVSLPQNS
jgi:hypothetical protein